MVGPQRLQCHPLIVSKRQVGGDGETLLLYGDPLLEPTPEERRKPQQVQSPGQADTLAHFPQQSDALPEQGVPLLELSHAQGN